MVNDLYLRLRQNVLDAGLLVKNSGWYAFMFSLLFVIFAAGAFAIVTFNNWAIQIPLMIFLSILMVQFGFLGHDSGHDCISNKRWLNDAFGQAAMSVLCGVSLSYWRKQHNTHHANSNIDQKDPDMGHLVAFTKEEKQRRKGLMKFISNHQTGFFIFSQAFATAAPRFNSIPYIFKQKWAEIPLILLHYALWVGIPLMFIGPLKTLVLYGINNLVSGWYFSFVFSPNHIGMPSPKSDEKLPFMLLQAVTSRNIKGSWFTDFVFGGLNFQIEHHLFPTLPRHKLRAVQKMTKEFFQKHKLPYHSVSVVKAYKEIFSHVASISRD